MSELEMFTRMLDRTGIGYGTRLDHSPPGTSVQVEHPVDDADNEWWVSEWSFDEAGQLTEVSHYQGEPG